MPSAANRRLRPAPQQEGSGAAGANAFEELSIPIPGAQPLRVHLYGRAIQRPQRAVILVHGFAAEKTENGLFTDVVRALTAQCSWVLLYDWRGLGDNGDDCLKDGLERHARDFCGITKWLLQASKVPSRELVAVGFSLGAAVIGLGLQEGAEVGRAVFWSPALRPARDMWPRYNTEEVQNQISLHGFASKNGIQLGPAILESLRNTDLAEYVPVVRVPILICHGTHDERIPVDTSRQLFQLARATECPIEFHEFPGASHSFRPERQHRPELLKTFSEWLSCHEAAVSSSRSALKTQPAAPARKARARRRPRLHPALY